MPAKNPRINVTLSPETHARIKRISELTGNSQSNLVATLLDTQGEVFDRLIRVLAAAEDAKETLKGKHLADDMLRAQSQIEKQLGLALENVDAVTDSFLKDVETIKRRGNRAAERSGLPARPRSAPVASTPISNRGVRSTPKRPKTSSKTRG